MTKIFNFALKIKRGGREGGTCEVLIPCHPPKFETCTWGILLLCKLVLFSVICCPVTTELGMIVP